MKPTALAAKLNGMDLDDFPSELNSEARAAGLVVVLGVSSDAVEFYGAITGEANVLGGETIYFDTSGLLPGLDDVEKMSSERQRAYYERKKFAASIDAGWQQDGFSWTFTSALPHSRFVAHKDGARYCRGIVFRLVDLGFSAYGNAGVPS